MRIFIIGFLALSQIAAMDDRPTTHDVSMAYRLILGREAESAEALDFHTRNNISVRVMRAEFLRSDEFSLSVVKELEALKRADLSRKTDDLLLFPYNADLLFLGQDSDISNIGLNITLTDHHDDMLYESLFWHFRLGFRNFNINYSLLSEVARSRLQMFKVRTEGICTIKENMDLGSNLDWVLNTNGREFLCLLNSVTMSSLIDSLADCQKAILPVCSYTGGDIGKASEFMITTDQIITERTPISLEFPYEWQRQTRTGGKKVRTLSNAYMANFTTLDAITSHSNSLVTDPLPFYEMALGFVRHIYQKTSFLPRTVGLSESSDFLRTFNQSEGYICPFILPGCKAIYAGIAKIGSSTIREAFFSKEIQRRANIEKLRQISIQGRGGEEYFFYDAFALNLLENPDVFKFTCVRNPYPRALSMYLHIFMQNASIQVQLGVGEQEHSFAAFLKAVRDFPQKNLLDGHFRSQVSCTAVPIVSYDRIIHLENFNTEFQEVMSILNIPGTPNDYRVDYHATNASNKLSDYYTQECVDLVLEIYGKDFEYFGYDKTPHFTLKTE